MQLETKLLRQEFQAHPLPQQQWLKSWCKLDTVCQMILGMRVLAARNYDCRLGRPRWQTANSKSSRGKLLQLKQGCLLSMPVGILLYVDVDAEGSMACGGQHFCEIYDLICGKWNQDDIL